MTPLHSLRTVRPMVNQFSRVARSISNQSAASREVRWSTRHIDFVIGNKSRKMTYYVKEAPEIPDGFTDVAEWDEKSLFFHTRTPPLGYPEFGNVYQPENAPLEISIENITHYFFSGKNVESTKASRTQEADQFRNLKEVFFGVVSQEDGFEDERPLYLRVQPNVKLPVLRRILLVEKWAFDPEASFTEVMKLGADMNIRLSSSFHTGGILFNKKEVHSNSKLQRELNRKKNPQFSVSFEFRNSGLSSHG